LDSRPIGVFDSGVGGLTVVREIFRQLPQEPVLYLGDTARVPYGPRGDETVRRFALELVTFLLARDVKALVVACNTISACALETIHAVSPVPVVDVIAPTVEAALAASKRQVLGVIGTVATVGSGVYHRAVQAARPEAELLAQPCPLFVPIAEEGLGDHAVASLMAEEYLGRFRGSPLDVLILGCTHYPLLKGTLSRVLGPGVSLVDSAEPTVAALSRLLREKGLSGRGSPSHRFCVTDASYKFMQIATRFLGREVSGAVSEVTLEELPRGGFSAGAAGATPAPEARSARPGPRAGSPVPRSKTRALRPAPGAPPSGSALPVIR
jgi:glutamate racemase